jgi:hypothetical protein
MAVRVIVLESRPPSQCGGRLPTDPVTARHPLRGASAGWGGKPAPAAHAFYMVRCVGGLTSPGVTSMPRASE